MSGQVTVEGQFGGGDQGLMSDGLMVGPAIGVVAVGVEIAYVFVDHGDRRRVRGRAEEARPPACVQRLRV